MSLALRAALAVVLLVGFYALALAMAGALALAPLLEILFLERIHLQLALLCLAGAALIAWSILPRIDRFEAPGPQLLPDDHPRLFATLRSVADQTEQAMPAEVYLVPDLNAWVAQRGGMMGIGSRRVMGLGLPLLQALTVPQLRAVLAHEFGHYHGGDTALGPWIYKTRAAIGRTLQNLGSTGLAFMALVQLPFHAYGKLFLRITHAVSRAQEYGADRLAARTQGAQPLIEGLRRVHRAGLAYGAYWNNEVVPALQQGFRPPVAEGFGRFMGTERLSQAIDEAMADEMEHGTADPYDTHPPLRDRIAALQQLDDGRDADPDPSPAISLLDDVDAAEASLFRQLAPDLRPIAWEDTGDRVYGPMWRQGTAAVAGRLHGVTAGSLPTDTASLSRLGRAAVGAQAEGAPEHLLADVGVQVLGTALAAALVEHGWSVEALPGEPVRLRRGDQVVRPFEWVQEWHDSDLDTATWRARCERAGIADLPLG